MKQINLLLLIFSFVLVQPNTVEGDVRLPSVISDNMVLQSDMPVPIWGWAQPGEKVAVRFAGQTKKTVAGEGGKWSIRLDPLKASNHPATMTIKAGVTTELKNVLVGEVWLCAGQSNMEWPLSKAANAQEALGAVGNPSIRLLNRVGAARGGSGKYTPEHLSRMTTERFITGSWQACTSETASAFSAVGYFFGRELHEELKVPVGLINVAIGGTPTEAWISRQALAAHPKLRVLVEGNWLDNPHTGQWCRQRARYNFSRAVEAGEVLPGDGLGPNHSFKPTFMWQAAVEPLTRLAVRGVLWYQGESNSLNLRRVIQHDQLLPLLIEDWRRSWRRKELPFLFVQLPGMGTAGGYKSQHWPEFRQGQLSVLQSLPNTGMAVTIDLGHPTSVHPTKKQPVGKRLALWALGTVYREDIVYSGPLYRSMAISGDVAVVSFDYPGSDLRTDDNTPPRHFEIAGADGMFHPAQAKIDGDKVIVHSSLVPQPRHIRYAWAPFPQPPVNLANSAGLPASPFSTAYDRDEPRTLSERDKL